MSLKAPTKAEPRFPQDVLPELRFQNSRGAEPAAALAFYRQMQLIRIFEDVVQPLYNAGEIHGTTHLCTGQEAISVGVASVLERHRDRIACTYRGHGHAIALGSSAQGLMDELLGKASGTGGGRAGSMNVIDLENGLLGCFGIVGGSIAAATGAALALRGSGAVAVAFFGDGTANQGYFHECLNFAVVHELPLLLVCENNLYGEFTPYEKVTGGALAGRPAGMGIPSERIHGNDVWEVQGCASQLVSEIRSDGGPRFIEALTYRFGGHSRSDQGGYRPDGELDAWKAYDPLVLERRHLIDELGVSAEQLDALDAEVSEEVDAIVERARSAPWPSPDPSLTEFSP